MTNLYDGNNIIRRTFEKRFYTDQTMTLRMRFEEQCATPGIWVWDGLDHNERRRDVYPPYKMNRQPTPENVYAQVNLWKELLKYTPAASVTVHGWEADDVIGTLVRKAPGRFTVHTNDQDYGQIQHLCKLVGVNMKGVDPNWITLYKAMVGDSSDNIAGIPNFGPKRWVEMQPYWSQIRRAIVIGDPAGFVGLPFKPGVAGWLAVADNIKLLQDMFHITHFQNVPDDELNGGITTGKLDRMAGHSRLSEFFL